LHKFELFYSLLLLFEDDFIFQRFLSLFGYFSDFSLFVSLLIFNAE